MRPFTSAIARAAAPRLVDEVRPQLRLDEDEQRRVQDVEGAAHRVREVEGRVEEAVDAADALLRHRVAGHRGRGEEDAVAREALAQRGHERAARPGPRRRTRRGSRSTGRRPRSGRRAAGPSARGRSAGISRWRGPSRGTRAGRGRSRPSGGGYRGCALAAPRAGAARKSARKYNVRRGERPSERPIRPKWQESCIVTLLDGFPGRKDCAGADPLRRS